MQELLLKDPPSQADVMFRWPTDAPPVLSIACIAYNHSKYIDLTLKGFLLQSTSFPFEIIVHDDASTDETVEIIKAYQKRYPKIIKLVTQKENQYSKGMKPLSLIYPFLKGKYVAYCEGDDYWVDPFKLEKQVAFLESHPEYVITGHDACIVNESGKLLQNSKLPDWHKRDYSQKDLQEGRAFLLTLSWVFRRVLGDDLWAAERSVVSNGDNFILSLLGQHGGSHFHDDIQFGVYRRHEGGVWSELDKKSRLVAQATTFLMISNFYRRVGQGNVADVWWVKFCKLMILSQPTLVLVKELMLRVTFAREIKAFSRRIISLVKKKV